jgi:4-amino-4-deoxy-L-arabinose transferase-like glycosyltransferase
MKTFLMCIAIAFALFMGTYRLVETPPTWMDEGLITQVAVNMTTQGVYGYQTAPGIFISAEFLTTSYPVIFPLIAVFKIWGVGLIEARTLMVLFILVFILGAYHLVREEARFTHWLVPLLSLLLLVSFAPLYGHGKNVLGEVPGLMLFVSALYFLSRMEKGSERWGTALSAGLCAGLAMATKPIYLIVLVPSLIITLYFFRVRFSFCKRMWLFIGCLLPVICWYLIQFAGTTQLSIFTGNPDTVSFTTLLINNLRRFVTEFQPLYFAGLLIVWWSSVHIRSTRNRRLSAVETIALIFSTVNLCAYTVTLGYYRYFFPGEIIALIFFVPSLWYVWDLVSLRIPFLTRRVFFGFVVMLIGFQMYQTLFTSWIAEYRNSNRAQELATQIGSLSADKLILFYNVPEAVIFLSHHNYLQYIRLADSVIRGEENVRALESGVPDMVLVDQKFDLKNMPVFYKEKNRFDKYVLFEKSATLPK